MDENVNVYKNLLVLAQKIMHYYQIPAYKSKYNKRDFTNHQLISLMIIKTYENKRYRDFIEFLKISEIPKILRLKKIPLLQLYKNLLKDLK